MKSEQKRTCEAFESLLVKKITGELLPKERESLESHLAQCAFCAAEEQELSGVWQRFESPPVAEISAALYEKTRETILSDLKQGKSLFRWAERIPREGVWSLFSPFMAGSAMTGISYGLIRNLVDLTVHHRHVLIALFGLWVILFAGCVWLILNGREKKTLSLDVVAASSISIALMTLLVFWLVSGVDSLRWLHMSAAYEVAAASSYLFGVGNTFVTGWWIYACVASFIGGLIFGLHRGSAFSRNALLGSSLVTILLFPAIYLHGSSHGHGYGILAFAALGTFVGALLGTGAGFFLRSQISFQAA